MSTVGESPPDEDPGVRTNALAGADRGKDASQTENEPAMLDEEEMPSYVSLTSLAIPEEYKAEASIAEGTETAESHQECSQSSCASEHGGESVCVLSSGEESDRRPFAAMEDYDSEEMDMEEEEEAEEEEDEEDSCMNEEEEDSDGDIEPEQFERSSDDFVLRYDSGLDKRSKERSRSLQDLTNSSRGNLSRFVGKRRSIDRLGPYEPEFTRDLGSLEDPLDVRKKMPRALKYNHVTSKVKLYIQEMKEQRRRSAERANRHGQAKNASEPNAREEMTSGPESPKRIKSYARNALNEIKTSTDAEANCVESIGLKAAEMTMATSTISEVSETENESQCDGKPENLARKHGMVAKPNGLSDHASKDEENIRNLEMNGSAEDNPGIFDLRSLTFEEYTNGGEVTKLDKPRVQETAEIVTVTETEVRRLVSNRQDEKSAYVEHVNAIPEANRNTWNLRELTLQESRRKVAQVDSEVYQRMLEENVSVKRELEETRRELERCRAEKRELEEARKKLEDYAAQRIRPETSIASVQTEDLESAKKRNDVTANAKESASKVFSSTVTSVLSSIEQWTDSNYSPTISIDPPNIEAALNADDSLALGERNTKMSRSFLTSSRILQALENITQGRAKTGVQQSFVVNSNNNNNGTRIEDSPRDHEQGQSKRQTPLRAAHAPNPENESRPRKRTAADMLGLSNHSESFKIPHTPRAATDTRRKMSSGSATDSARNGNNEARTGRTATDKKLDECTGLESRTEDNDNNDKANNVRSIVYYEEPDCNERSFLIQADDPPKGEQTEERGGKVRECGPFLLGNIEIRMSETNGTLNIWGKEIGDSSEEPEAAMDTDDSEPHERSSFASRASIVCQSTPHPKCSHTSIPITGTTKKPRISPKFSRSGIGKYLRTAASNLSRNNSSAETCSCDACAISPRRPAPMNERTKHHCCCEHAEIQRQKRIKSSSCCEHRQTRAKHHATCCLHDVEGRDSDCASDNEVFDNSTIYEKISNILSSHEKYTSNNAASKQTCAILANEEFRQAWGCSSHGREEDARQTNRRCSSCNADPISKTRLAPGACRDDNVSARSQTHISCEDEAHPLLSSDPPCETPETKRRRLSGKKVRGILTDLLRGCSGCREPNSTSSLPRANLQNVSSKMHLSTGSPSQGSCPKRTHSCPSHLNHSSNESNERCCKNCNRRGETRAEIENQLEIFRVTMEQLRSRLDGLVEMLHLLNADTD